MSRCEAFPPPNYVWNGARCEALLEAIKVWRENAVAEKRRKNKEKRKRKRDFGEIREERRSHKHKKKKKVDENENELSETSNPTQEHDQPICDSLYDSSDNTENVKDLAPRPHRGENLPCTRSNGCMPCSTLTNGYMPYGTLYTTWHAPIG